jgi:chromosome segregation ATPase
MKQPPVITLIGSPSSPLDLELEVNDLRGRLDRRNALLDVIRKAYHRDVIVVKECILDAKRRDSNPNANELLTTIPSIDLRDEGFRLFAPQECELRIRPCYTCGGQLEVIHRESSRIVNFKHAIHLLEEMEHDLRVEMIDVKVQARQDRSRLVDTMQKTRDERNVLMEQISSLKYHIADQNSLDKEVKQLKEDKARLETQLEQQAPILLDHERLVVEIEEAMQNREQWKEKYHQQVRASELLQEERNALLQRLEETNATNDEFQQKLHASREQFKQLHDACSTMTLDLTKSRDETKEAEMCLHKAEQAIDELEAESEQERKRTEEIVTDMKSKCNDLSKRVSDLDETARMKSQEAEGYLRKIEATLEGARRRGLIVSVPRSSDAAFAKTDELIRETENLRHKAAALSSLLLSCIRATYENCLVQEKTLRDNGSELHKNAQKLKTSTEPTNEKARLVLASLGDGSGSDSVEWTSMLAHENDQRHVLGNLQNRLQIGQFSLNKCFDKTHKEHTVLMRKCHDEHRKQIEEKVSRIWELEKLLTDSISLNRQYEGKMARTREKQEVIDQMLEETRRIVRKARKECTVNNDITSQLKEDYFKLRLATLRLLEELRVHKEMVHTLDETLVERQEDINARDNAMGELEKLLERITHKYAENERLRVKVTHEVATQVMPEVEEKASHADFLPTPLRTVQSTPIPDDDVKSSDALLPGRIIHIKDENDWPLAAKSYPSIINIGTKAGFGYRAIDML